MTFALSRTARRSLHALSWTAAAGGILVLDAESGEVVDVNPAAEGLLGYPREAILGRHISLFHPVEERERVRREFFLIEGESRFFTGFHVERDNGELSPVAIRALPPMVLDGRPVLLYLYRDNTEIEFREHQMLANRWALSAYSSAALALGQKHTSESLLEAICEAVTRESIYVLAWVGIAEETEDKKIQIVARAGSSLDYMNGLQVSWAENHATGKGPTGICIRTGKIMIMDDSEEMEFFAPWRERARYSGIRSAIAIPIFLDAERRGVLMIYATRPNAFEQEAIDVFQSLAEQISHGIHAIEQRLLLDVERTRILKMQTQLSDALSAMVAPIVTAMEMRDLYTAGHQSRVSEIAVMMAREMGWLEEQIQGLRVAAAVHDVGKISIPAEILTKPGRLGAAEWSMVQGHSETGYTILKDIPFVWPIAEIVRQHHEKLDGSGYPLGLTGDAILPEAKVLAVADIVEAMASNRPYRPSIELGTVLNALESQAGSLLDAEAVRVCVAIFREGRMTLPGMHYS